VIEEAHRLLENPGGGGRGGEVVGADARTKAVALFVDMLAEIRAFGQGIMIVEQIPTKLADAAIKNTNLKIMLRLTSRDDRDYLGEAMNFNEEQKQFVSTLRAERNGQVQYVAFDENVDQPVLLSLPLRPRNGGRLFDEYFQVG
jgi:DNA helicase HerA-like ATPase